MSKTSQADPSNVHPNAVESQTPLRAEIDWRTVAEQRLTRLVEIEHDHSVMLDRLALLQVDYLEVVVASEGRLAQIGELASEKVKLQRRLGELEHAHHLARVAFEDIYQSRSWRVTRPLRVVSGWLGRGGLIGKVARHLLRVPLVRRSARAVARRLPGLHERIRARLYDPARRQGPP